MAKKRNEQRKPSRKQRRDRSQQPARSAAWVAAELLEEGDAEAAAALLEPLVARYPDMIEYRTLLGAAYGMIEDYAGAIQQFEAIIALDPDNDLMYVPLGMFYANLGYLILAAHTLTRTLQSADALAPPLREQIHSVLQEANQAITALAAEKSIPWETAREALYWTEMGIAQGYALGDVASAIQAFHKAIAAVPDWPLPHSHLAPMLFMEDRPQEAIATLKHVLDELDPDNLDALVNILRIYLALDEREQAAPYRERLQALEPQLDLNDATVFNQLIEGYALAGNHQAVYRLLRQTQLPMDEWDHPEWLGTAAANLGRMTEAVEHWRSLSPKQAIGLTSLLLRAVEEEWGWPPDHRFPYYAVYELLPPPVYEMLTGGPEEPEEEEGEEGEVPWDFERVREWARRYPCIADAIALSLWHPDSSEEELETVVELLAGLGTPRAMELLRAFATGQRGPENVRLWVADTLVELGAIPAGSILRMWIDGRWQDVVAGSQWREPGTGRPYPPEVIAGLEAAIKAQQAQRYDEARQAYQGVLAQAPRVAEAHVGLANLDLAEERYDLALSHIRQALEIVPDYGQAYLLAALVHVRREAWDEAIAALEQTEGLWLPPELEVSREETWIFALARKGDKDGAYQHLDRLAALIPEDQERIESLRMYIAFLDATSAWVQYMRKLEARRKQRALTRPILATDLLSLLSGHNKETLMNMARCADVPFRQPIRKGELVQLLATGMLDPAVVHRVVGQLSSREQAALRQVIERGGQITYAELADMVGPEPEDESIDWYYRPPTSAIGRLRARGLLFAGSRAGQTVLVMANELRPLIAQALELT